MSKIKTIKAFKEGIDAAFETLKTRDEAKASFQGEDMRMYPFFGTAVAPAGEPAD